MLATMKDIRKIEVQHAIDVGRDFTTRVDEYFGVHSEQTERHDHHSVLAPSIELLGVQRHELTGLDIVPVDKNIGALALRHGQIIGIQCGKAIRPAIITRRALKGQHAAALPVTWLDAPEDVIDPSRPELTPLQCNLLAQAAEHQDPEVGAGGHGHDASTAGELGHQTVGMAALLQPRLLDDPHAVVHGWADSNTGIATEVTDQKLGLYDIQLSNGHTRTVREPSGYMTEGVVLLHPNFPNMSETPDIQQFATGLGIIRAAQVYGDAQRVQNQLMTNLERL